MKMLLLAMLALGATTPAVAQIAVPPEHEPADQRVFVMGGRMTASDFGEAFNPITSNYENAIIMGGGYQRFLGEPIENLNVGIEVGAAIRSGDKATGEVWAGLVARHDGLVIGDAVRVSPSLTFGASAVTDTMGTEAEREAKDGLPGNLLFYLSPEISFASLHNPHNEVFVRLHHRSGAWNTFGGGGSANATMIGVRTSF